MAELVANTSGSGAFYIYPDAAFDFSAALECHPSWHLDDQSAEAAMLEQLRRHPARTLDPLRASLFVVPIMPYVSLCASKCQGDTHEHRMSRAAAALRRSPYLARHGGHDHMLITNTFRIKAFGPWLKPLLPNATVAWFEQPLASDGEKRAGTLYRLAWWRCTIVIPYLANPFCLSQREIAPEETRRLADSSSSAGAPPAPKTARRRARAEASLFFQGSLEAAGNLRRRIRNLQTMKNAHVHDVPRACSVASNTSAACAEARVRSTRLHTARGMLANEFCLVPRGDTPTSGRLFAALACRCVPIIVSKNFKEHYPHAAVGRYDQWTVSINEPDFVRGPTQAVATAMEAARPRLGAMREAMERASVELLYDVPGSRVADNLLREWETRRCSRVDSPSGSPAHA